VLAFQTNSTADLFPSFLTGWVVVVATLGMYARLAYLHRTSDNLERLLGASVTALTFLIAWAAFAIILTIHSHHEEDLARNRDRFAHQG
jgi:integral membrane sensor domain MASE1